MTSAKEKLAVGRYLACSTFKYFRSAIMMMVPKECPGLNTFGVTKDGVMLYDPKILEVWKVKEIAAVIIHEVSHLLRKHDARKNRLQANQVMWNHAADCEINDDLEAARLSLPTEPFEPVTPSKLGFNNGLTAEEYYRLLESIQELPSQTKKQKQAEGSGEGDKGKSGSETNEKKESKEKGEASGEKPRAGSGWCGSAAGRPIPGEEDIPSSDKRSEVELERVRRQVATAIQQEAKRSRGSVSQSWARWAEEQLTPPVIRWQDKLGRIIRGSIAHKTGSVDLHYSKVSRRQAGIGYGIGKPILPALRSPIPKVACILDTSGSMTGKDLTAALSEIRSVLQTVNCHVTFCACDAAVHSLKRVRQLKDLIPLVKGGGGTDMRPAFEEVSKSRPRPDVVIVLTDGCLGDGVPKKIPTGLKVIWALIGENSMQPCDWGEHIMIKQGK